VALSTTSSIALSGGVALLFAWRLYARVRRMVGRQRLSRVRPWLSVTVFPLLIVLFLLTSLSRPLNTAGLFGGAVVGGALGLYGLRLTRFERTPDGLFYTPNAHLGVALSALLVGRIVYRLARLYFATSSFETLPTGIVRNPITLVLFGTLAGYYASYAAGLLRWRWMPRSSRA